MYVKFSPDLRKYSRHTQVLVSIGLWYSIIITKELGVSRSSSRAAGRDLVRIQIIQKLNFYSYEIFRSQPY